MVGALFGVFHMQACILGLVFVGNGFAIVSLNQSLNLILTMYIAGIFNPEAGIIPGYKYAFLA